MGVFIIDINSGETIEDSNKADDKRWKDGDREMGERHREEDSRSRLPFGPAVTPGLMEVPVTPAIEKRDKWHPGLTRTPAAPVPRKKEPVFH